MSVQVVSFHCVLKNKLGQVLSSSFNKDVVISKPSNDPGLNYLIECMKDLRPGEKRQLTLGAESAYGFYDPKLIIRRDLEQLELSKPLEVGDSIIYTCLGRDRLYRVLDLSEDSVTLDGNHPLAGQDLIFEIEATEAWEAMTEDLIESDSVKSSQKLH